VIATKTALKLADYVVTEAGFGADLGAEKFFDIKCRKAGLRPSAVVIVATVRALKMHGGVKKDDLGKENVAAVAKGCANLTQHLNNLKNFGVPAVVAVNRFSADTDTEIEAIQKAARSEGAEAFMCTHWADGSAGTEELAKHVVKVVDSGKADFKPLYRDDMPLIEKVRTIAQKLYRADDIACDGAILKQFEDLEKAGYGKFPVCMAKTQYSFSADPDLKGAPRGFKVPVRELRISAGAEFIVAITGAIMTMPGLPRVPAANSIYLIKQGQIEGLF
jgi:formate--tetrahydrofolate ligase